MKLQDSDYYISLTVHIVRNVLDLPKIKVDLAMKKLPVLHWAS